MKLIVVLEVLSVQLLLTGYIAYPAFADGAPATVIQTAQLVVQLPQVVIQAPPVVVERQPVVVERQEVVVERQPVVVEPYTVVERGASIVIDPEDYYYVNGGSYYHHYYLSDSDVVVRTVPSGQHFVHNRIDLSKIAQKHFRHGQHPRSAEKQKKRDR